MERIDLENIVPQAIPDFVAQLRFSLSNLHLAAASLVSAEDREQDASLDMRAALLDQSYYQLLRVTNNLAFAAYFAENDKLPQQNCDIVALVRENCEKSRQLAGHIGLSLEFSAQKEPCFCAADREALEQLLFQLLSNAFKFTPRGGTVAVEVGVADGQVRLTVSDTGCGMSPEKLAGLFSAAPAEFPRLPPHGVGLGLILCRRIAESHGGTLVVESREGKGTRVVTAFPLRRSERATVEDVPFDYSGGFNRTLLGLADALPASAFRVRQQD